MFRPIRGFLIVAAALALAPIAASAQEKGKGPPPLPEGKGKQFVEGICSTCHATQLIVSSSGYTREQWRELTSYMAFSRSAAPTTLWCRQALRSKFVTRLSRPSV